MEQPVDTMLCQRTIINKFNHMKLKSYEELYEESLLTTCYKIRNQLKMEKKKSPKHKQMEANYMQLSNHEITEEALK